MAGTKAGGLKAAATNKAKYGKEFYARIGAKGGRLGHTGGFAVALHHRSVRERENHSRSLAESDTGGV